MDTNAAVLIDGGYFSKLRAAFNCPTVNLAKLSDTLCAPHSRLRTYYYDALPWIAPHSPSQTASEAEKSNYASDIERKANKQRFFDAISMLPRFEVRLGRLQKNLSYCSNCKTELVKFDQKLVDVLLSVDLVRLAWSKQAGYLVIVGGDSDFVPAVKTAKDAGAIVKVVYAKMSNVSIHRELLQTCDERTEIDANLLKLCV